MVMKMAAVSTVSLLLLCCSVISSADSEEACDVHAAAGGDSVVPLRYKLDNHREALSWVYESSSADKQTIFSRKANNIIVSGKMEDVYENGSLKLINVTKSSAGKYTPIVFDQNGKKKGDFTSIQLCVLDPVPKPKVKMDCFLSFVSFTCKVGAQAKNFNIEWLKNNKVLQKEKFETLKQNAEQVEKDSFMCKVSNRVSTVSSDPVTQNCFKYKPILPETFLGLNTWIFVAAGGGIVLLLIIIVIVCCICTKRKKRMQLKDEGELRLAWTNDQHQHNHPPHHHHHPPPNQHKHHHHHHHQQQPAGHTGPRQHRSKQHRDQQRPRASEQGSGLPLPNPRRPAQAPMPVDKVDDEQPPPIPQPRKKTPKTQRV